MPYCNPCDRFFSTLNGYQNHLDNSFAHMPYRYKSDPEPEPRVVYTGIVYAQYGNDPEPEFPCFACTRDFWTSSARHMHCVNSHGERYCAPCERMFNDANCLMQHQHSRVHVGTTIQCPFCKNSFATASGVTIHLESGNCSSGINRAQIDRTIQQLDRGHVITNRLLTMPDYEDTETFATEASWNGSGYQCYLCRKVFGRLSSLNMHLKSPAHEQALYRCPQPSCHRNYKLLSSLVQHFESESCGVMRFNVVQQNARDGIQNMVGRMISG